MNIIMTVRESGGPLGTDCVEVGVGTLKAVGVIASNAPEIGTIVGTIVGLGKAVGWEALEWGVAPILFLH